MKKAWLVISVFATLIILLMLLGCEVTESAKTVPVKPLRSHLTPIRQDWIDVYGDTLESQIVFNLVILRRNDLVIAEVINRLHPQDPNEVAR